MRLIDADKYCDFLNKYPLEKAQNNFMIFYRDALQHTFECEVDAVPIVRCKDCKYYDEQTFMGHSMGWASCSGRFANVNDNGMRFEIPSEDWFCADGEREIEDATN